MATLDLDPAAGTFDPAELQRILDGRYAALRAQIREVMSRPEFEAVSRQIGELCDRVRAQAGDYVDAFGIPDTVLRAPIAIAGGDR